MMAETRFDVTLARDIIARRRSTPGAALPILHELQHHFGYIDDAAIPLVAEALNLSRAETLGLVSFYPDFRRAPVEGRVLKLCRANPARPRDARTSSPISQSGMGSLRTEARVPAACRDRLLPGQLRALARGSARR